MFKTRWCGCILTIFLLGPSMVLADETSEACWDQLTSLPSNATATTKLNSILDCTAEQGVTLADLRTDIQMVENARDEAVTARDEAIALLEAVALQTMRLEEIMLSITNPWEETANNLHDLMLRVGDSYKSHADVPALQEYEYGIMRNGDFRELTFSTWNGGWRIATTAHPTGDTTDEIKIGGSLWLYRTDDASDDGVDRNGNVCGEQGRLRHYYYYLGATGNVVEGRSGNGCTLDGPIYRRDRPFN